MEGGSEGRGGREGAKAGKREKAGEGCMDAKLLSNSKENKAVA